MKTDCIEREVAMAVVNGWRDQLIPTYGKNDEYVKCLETVAEHLESLPAADVVSGSDFRDCRNELCLKCGNYTQAHNGACDGCRWKECGNG